MHDPQIRELLDSSVLSLPPAGLDVAKAVRDGRAIRRRRTRVAAALLAVTAVPLIWAAVAGAAVVWDRPDGVQAVTERPNPAILVTNRDEWKALAERGCKAWLAVQWPFSNHTNSAATHAHPTDRDGQNDTLWGGAVIPGTENQRQYSLTPTTGSLATPRRTPWVESHLRLAVTFNPAVPSVPTALQVISADGTQLCGLSLSPGTYCQPAD